MTQDEFGLPSNVSNKPGGCTTGCFNGTTERVVLHLKEATTINV
jgi:hypothetical protein